MLPDYPAVFWATAVAAVILVGIAKAGFGGGASLVATPLMALTISVIDAAALLLPLLIVIDLLSVRHYRRHYDSQSLRLLLPSALMGIVPGALLFSTFRANERFLQIGIGLLALIFAFYQMFQERIPSTLAHYRPSATVGRLLGGLAGFTSTLAHAGGPVTTIYLLPQMFPRQVFVGTTVLFFTVVNIVKLIPYSFLGLLRVGNLLTIALLAPFCYVGVRLGIYLNGRFTDLWFNRFIIILLFLTGMQLLIGKSLLSLIVNG